MAGERSQERDAGEMVQVRSQRAVKRLTDRDLSSGGGDPVRTERTETWGDTGGLRQKLGFSRPGHS